MTSHATPDAVAPPPGNPRFPLFDGLRGMIERLDARLDEMNRSWKATDADREKVLADHTRRIVALERSR